jgi:glycosyltransferase involved in cell wall biosynthesis
VLKLVIAIPTYKRPALLGQLLASVLASQVDAARIGEVQVVVVDNDASSTAEPVVAQHAPAAPRGWAVHYRRCPQRGLAHVRNAMLDEALAASPDYIVFVDDDQYVPPHWLQALVDCMERTGSEFALGPVKPVHDVPPRPEIAHWFRMHERDDGQPLDQLETNNLIMRTRFVVQHALRFDARFNVTGAEDTYFGVTALRRGARIVWAREAVAFEVIPAERATLRWLLRRRFRGAGTYTYILVLERRWGQVLKKAAVSLIYLGIGLAGLPLLALRGHARRFHGLLRLAEAAGAFAGLLHLRLPEYAARR